MEDASVLSAFTVRLTACSPMTFVLAFYILYTEEKNVYCHILIGSFKTSINTERGENEKTNASLILFVILIYLVTAPDMSL